MGAVEELDLRTLANPQLVVGPADLGVLVGDPLVGRYTVVVASFTRWGGLQRRTLTIERAFPQRILEEQIEVVAPCDCGITF